MTTSAVWMRSFPLPQTAVDSTSEKVYYTKPTGTKHLSTIIYMFVYAGLHGRCQCITTFLAYKIDFPAETAQVAHRILIKLKSLNKKSPRQP